MAYKVRKQRYITEQLEIEDPNNGESKVFNVKIDVLASATRYNKQVVLMAEAEKIAKKSEQTPEEKEKIGQAIIGLFEIIFGDQTEEILKFYENDYVGMLNSVYPFVIDRIKPAFEEAQKELKDNIRSRYLG